ncbi:hypothetical protein MHYP_G00052760 [Metynnis hypsauchen]
MSPAMLRLMIKHDAHKLSLSSGIPDTVEELPLWKTDTIKIFWRWPAFFDVIQVKEEFKRLTATTLESQFYSNLDKYTDRLFRLFRSKGGNAVRKKNEVLMLLDQHINGDLDPDDLKYHILKIVTKGGSAVGSPLEAGIVLEGVQDKQKAELFCPLFFNGSIAC